MVCCCLLVSRRRLWVRPEWFRLRPRHPLRRRELRLLRPAHQVQVQQRKKASFSSCSSSFYSSLVLWG